MDVGKKGRKKVEGISKRVKKITIWKGKAQSRKFYEKENENAESFAFSFAPTINFLQTIKKLGDGSLIKFWKNNLSDDEKKT